MQILRIPLKHTLSTISHLIFVCLKEGPVVTKHLTLLEESHAGGVVLQFTSTTRASFVTASELTMQETAASSCRGSADVNMSGD